jgi:hypothetical protein
MGVLACLQCGTPAASERATFCRRCGLPYGAPPRRHAALPTCPVCYREVGDDGRLPSATQHGRRLDLQAHIAEHERHPVGDDELLESMREGERIRIGHWTAPFDVVRRYLVTGNLDGGRRRTFEHDTIVSAMTQLRRWGTDAGAHIVGDQPEWEAARAAVSELMERYHRRRAS